MTSGLVDEELHLDVPVRVAYDRWSQFEDHPRFMRRVHRVEQIRPAVTRWEVRLGPLRHEFHAEIREQHPDTSIAWRTLGRTLRHEGEVTFRPVSERASVLRLTMQLPNPAWLPPAPVHAILHPLVVADLTRFKAYVEQVGEGGEAWRGTIHEGRVEHIEHAPPPFPGWVHG